MTLIQAVLSNDLAAATELLRQGQAVDRKDALGYTPLMLASGLGNPQMVELLLTAGADVSILDNRMGASALHKAAQSGVVDVAKLLLQRGAFINLQSPTLGHTPLMDAVWHKRAGMVACLLEQGAKMTLQSHYGATALDFAQRDNLIEMIHLLKQQEQINQQLVEKQALMAAVLRNDVEAVQQMIEQGVDVNEKSPMLGGANDGHTPLLVAARDGQVEIIKLLLEAGANPHLIDDLMKATPGHKAGYMGHAEVVQLLVKADLELDAQCIQRANSAS